MYRLNYLFIFHFILISSFGFCQPANDACVNATRLCANQPLQGTTTAATLDPTSDFDFCTVNSATTWYLFTTNSFGDSAAVTFSGVSFNPDVTYGQTIDVVMFSTTTPCNQTSLTPVSNCGNFVGNATLGSASAVFLTPNTTYYILVNGSTGGAANSAECDFTIEISGPGVDASFPTASISALDTVLCQGDDEILETLISNCTDTITFDWYYNNMLYSSSATNDFSTTTLTEDGYLKLIINCGSLCVYSDTTDSIFYQVTPISANAGPDKFILDDDVVPLEGSGDGNALWTPANTLTDPTSFTPTASPSITTTYFLTVTNGLCEETDSVNVFVGEVITIFSGFSPNGDDINDKWVIKNSAQYPNMEVTVYDRSGQEVFQTIGYSTQDKWWDGTYKGKPLPVSTYFYVIDLKIGDEGIFKGPVNIIK